MELRQSAFASIPKNGPGDKGSTRVRITLGAATIPGSLVVIEAVTGGGVKMPHTLSATGYQVLVDEHVRDLQLVSWMRENAPTVSSVEVYVQAYRSMQLRIREYTGVSQSGALDRVTYRSGESRTPTSGATATTRQADELLVGVIANQYASTTQYGFTGGLAKLYESTSPASNDQDWERSRYTSHHAGATKTGSFSLSASLSTPRRWIAALFTFRGGSTGPLKLSSTDQPPVLDTALSGSPTLFGPLRSVEQPPVLDSEFTRLRIGPSTYQYRLGGWSGLLIGAGTPYRVESVEGLEGWEIRTSDAEQPNSDGALRGTDLQAARQILFKVNTSGTRTDIEAALDTLYRALVPQRDQDWELIWRHPGRPLRRVLCRPVNLARELTLEQTLLGQQAFALRAADPRHYSAQVHMVDVPISASRDNPVLAQAVNLGNAPAHPTIRILGPTSGDPAARVVLTNVTTDEKFDVRAVLPRGSTLLGDMPAFATGAPRSPVTIDNQSKYGAWQHPRKTFTIWPGVNQLMLEVEPAGTAVTCSVEYSSTGSG